MHYLIFCTIWIWIFLSSSYSFSQQLSGELKDKINHYLEASAVTNNFSGAALVAKNNQILLAKGYGMANYEFNVPNTIQTKFRIASLTKAFTAVLVLQQVERGKLRLEGKVTDYLPDYPRPKGDSITIHHLLSHTSGMPHYGGIPDFFNKYHRVSFTPQQYVKLFSSVDLLFTPGSNFNYSSFGYFLLGAILEKVSGKTYNELLQENICKPLGLLHTIVETDTSIILNRASGYDYLFDYKQDHVYKGLANAIYTDVSKAGAAGQLLSTVEDLYTFSQALSTDKLLSEPFRSLLFKPNLAHYGYGWNIGQITPKDLSKKLTIAEHGGSAIGFASYLSKNLDDGVIIILLSNRSNTFAMGMHSDITNIIYGKSYLMPKNPVLPQAQGNVTFRLKGYPQAGKVYLSGEFNNWHPRQTYMSRQGEEWIVSVNLEKGRHKYMFIVDGNWITDPQNPQQDKSSFTSSVLVVK